MSDYNDDHILEFKIRNGFFIKELSKKLVEMMQDANMDSRLYLPGGGILEIEKECSPEDIIEGYQSFIQSKISNNLPCNLNEKPELKPI